MSMMPPIMPNIFKVGDKVHFEIYDGLMVNGTIKQYVRGGLYRKQGYIIKYKHGNSFIKIEDIGYGWVKMR